MAKYEEDTKRFNEIAKNKIKCVCGHTKVMSKVDKSICNWCGRYIYKNEQIKFKDELRKKMRLIKNEKKN